MFPFLLTKSRFFWGYFCPKKNPALLCSKNGKNNPKNSQKNPEKNPPQKNSKRYSEYFFHLQMDCLSNFEFSIKSFLLLRQVKSGTY